jgi:ubiquinone/menaquinone biosynthesis C-methylase UbiE
MQDPENVFDTLTGKYDAWYDSEGGRPLYESELRCLRPMVTKSPILEVGVGTGRFAMHFPDVTGVDPAENALRMAEARGVRTVKAYGESLPFEDGTFGCVMIIVTFCFVENPLEVLKEAKRVLKKDGSIVIGLVPKDSQWGAFYEVKKKQGHPFYRRARFYTLRDMEEMLRKTGLRISRLRSTLLRSPYAPRMVEEPVEGYAAGAGFICIEAEEN